MLDADSGDVITHVVTDQHAGDGRQVRALVDEIGHFVADGAYDGNPTYDAVAIHSAGAAVERQTPISPVNETVISLRSTPMDG